MNRTAAFPILVALVILGGAAAARAQGAAYPVWEVADPEPGSSSCTGLVRLPGGDVVCVGSFPGAAGEELRAARIDEEGRFLWLTRVANPYGNGLVDPLKVLRSPLDEIVVLCRITGGPSVYDSFFVSLDPDDGQVDADRIVDHFDWDLAVDMEIGPSGNVVTCSYGIDHGQYLVSKLDPSFQTLWEVDLGNPGQDRQEPTDLIIAANGDVLVTGQVFDGVQQDVRVDRLTQGGAAIYSKDFGDPALDDHDGILYGSSQGGTYFAFRKAAYDPGAEARLYRLDQSGTAMWGIVDADLAWVAIQEIANDEFIVAGVGPFSVGTAQTFRKFDKLGNKLGIRTLLTEGYEHNWINGMTVGPDDIIYTTAYATPIGGGATSWFVNALTVDGGLVYQWSLDSGAGSYDFPKGLAALGHGRLVVCGEVGAATDDDAHIVLLQAQRTSLPSSVTVRSGRLLSGDADSLASLDGDRYRVCRGGADISSAQSPVNVEIESSVPGSYPSGSLELSFTARATTVGLTQELELWNWRIGAWDRSTTTELSTSNATTVVTGSVVDHIDATTGRVRARCLVAGADTAASNGWCVAVDQAVWLVQP